MGITREDIDAILAAFEASEWRTIQLKADGIEVMLSKDGAGLPAPVPTPAAAPPPPPVAEAPPASEPPPAETGTVVAAPSLGTFYRAPKPGAPPFTEVGARVAEGDELCLIEVMKLFTSVTAPCAGTIAAILASDGDLVEHAQPLFRIMPDGGDSA